MQQLPCPKCSTPIPVRVETADERGRVRLACLECDARVLIKVNPRALKLSPDIPPTPPEEPREDWSPEELTLWAVVIHEATAAQIGGVRRILLGLPRFRSNPNKLHDATDELPYVIFGLKRTEAAKLEEGFAEAGVDCEAGPQVWLLDEDMAPWPHDTRGPAPDVDGASTEEFESEEDSGEVEIAFDFSQSRNGDEAWLSDLEGSTDDLEVYSEGLAALDGDATGVDTSSSQPITSEVLVEDFDSYSFSDFEPSESLFDGSVPLEDTEDGPKEQDGFRVVTVQTIPGLTRVLGGVQAQVTRMSTAIGEDPDATIQAAIEEGRSQLAWAAQEMGAEGIAGLRITQSAVPGPSGWIWIVLLAGTAVGR